MSMSTLGSLRRSFISGTRLCPPAMILPLVEAGQVCQRVLDRRGATIVECDGNHAWPPWMMRHSFSGLSAMSRCFTPEPTQRVDRRRDDARRRAERAGLADALGAERVHRRRRHGGVQLEARKIDGARHRVVHERAGHQLAVLVVDGLLDHRLADALGQAAVDLSLDNQRVDEVAGIVHGDELEQPRLAGVLVDLEHRDVAAERVGVVGRLEERFVAQARLEPRRQRHRHVGVAPPPRRTSSPSPAPPSPTACRRRRRCPLRAPRAARRRTSPSSSSPCCRRGGWPCRPRPASGCRTCRCPASPRAVSPCTMVM